jgi:hypothetical protein
MQPFPNYSFVFISLRSVNDFPKYLKSATFLKDLFANIITIIIIIIIIVIIIISVRTL